MKPLYIEATASLPLVHFDLRKGVFHISGKSTDPGAGQFYAPLLRWIEKVSHVAIDELSFEFSMELLNIASYKRILFLMYGLKDLQTKGASVDIIWNYERHDRDMYLIGRDYADIIGSIPFRYCECRAFAQMEMKKAG